MSEREEGPMTWQEELASLVGDTGIRYASRPPAPIFDGYEEGSNNNNNRGGSEESLKDQVKEFLKASGEMVLELGRGVKDILQQSLEDADDFYLVRKLRGPTVKVAEKLEFLNDYLPEDRDPVKSWLVVIAVLLVALSVLNVNSGQQTSIELPKKLFLHPPSASRIQLPDGRYMAYREQGVSAERARYSLIAPHSFLSSRLAGIPGVKASLLDEFGVRLVTYDLPGFGESDPHPSRNLNSSAHDMLHLANAVGIMDKFWLVGYSGGGMHAWAAVHYIPERVAGVAMFAPMGNPYDTSMTKEERYKTWEKWTTKRKLLYVLARRFPSFLPFFYRRSFLSGLQGPPEKWLSLSLAKKDKALLEEQVFYEFWQRDIEESVRQGDVKPFVEEAVLQVSNWGFKLADLQVQKKHEGSGLLLWIKSLYSLAEREWAGFLGPIHVWQGMDDRVVPPAMTEFVRRLVPGATVHRLLGEGHLSYFCFCDECHRQVFSTLFGIPQGPIIDPPESHTPEISSSQSLSNSLPSPSEGYCEETTSQNCTGE